MIKKYIIVLSLCLLATLTSALSVKAQSSNTGNGPTSQTNNQTVNTKLENPFNGTGNSLSSLFTAIIQKILLPIGGVVAVLSFIWVGFMFVTAQGDPAKITTARTALWYTAIGTAVLLGAEAISLVLQTTITQLQ